MSDTKQLLEVMLSNNKSLEIVHEKLDAVSADISKIKEVQLGQAIDLKHHIKRTDLLEGMVLPIHNSKLQIMGVLKFLAIGASVATVAAGIAKLFTYFL